MSDTSSLSSIRSTNYNDLFNKLGSKKENANKYENNDLAEQAQYISKNLASVYNFINEPKNLPLAQKELINNPNTIERLKFNNIAIVAQDLLNDIYKVDVPTKLESQSGGSGSDKFYPININDNNSLYMINNINHLIETIRTNNLLICNNINEQSKSLCIKLGDKYVENNKLVSIDITFKSNEILMFLTKNNLASAKEYYDGLIKEKNGTLYNEQNVITYIDLSKLYRLLNGGDSRTNTIKQRSKMNSVRYIPSARSHHPSSQPSYTNVPSQPIIPSKTKPLSLSLTLPSPISQPQPQSQPSYTNVPSQPIIPSKTKPQPQLSLSLQPPPSPHSPIVKSNEAKQQLEQLKAEHVQALQEAQAHTQALEGRVHEQTKAIEELTATKQLHAQEAQKLKQQLGETQKMHQEEQEQTRGALAVAQSAHVQALISLQAKQNKTTRQISDLETSYKTISETIQSKVDSLSVLPSKLDELGKNINKTNKNDDEMIRCKAEIDKVISEINVNITDLRSDIASIENICGFLNKLSHVNNCNDPINEIKIFAEKAIELATKKISEISEILNKYYTALPPVKQIDNIEHDFSSMMNNDNELIKPMKMKNLVGTFFQLYNKLYVVSKSERKLKNNNKTKLQNIKDKFKVLLNIISKQNVCKNLNDKLKGINGKIEKINVKDIHSITNFIQELSVLSDNVQTNINSIDILVDFLKKEGNVINTDDYINKLTNYKPIEVQEGGSPEYLLSLYPNEEEVLTIDIANIQKEKEDLDKLYRDIETQVVELKGKQYEILNEYAKQISVQREKISKYQQNILDELTQLNKATNISLKDKITQYLYLFNQYKTIKGKVINSDLTTKIEHEFVNIFEAIFDIDIQTEITNVKDQIPYADNIISLNLLLKNIESIYNITNELNNLYTTNKDIFKDSNYGSQISYILKNIDESHNEIKKKIDSHKSTVEKIKSSVASIGSHSSYKTLSFYVGTTLKNLFDHYKTSEETNKVVMISVLIRLFENTQKLNNLIYPEEEIAVSINIPNIKTSLLGRVIKNQYELLLDLLSVGGKLFELKTNIQQTKTNFDNRFKTLTQHILGINTGLFSKADTTIDKIDNMIQEQSTALEKTYDTQLGSIEKSQNEREEKIKSSFGQQMNILSSSKNIAMNISDMFLFVQQTREFGFRFIKSVYYFLGKNALVGKLGGYINPFVLYVFLANYNINKQMGGLNEQKQQVDYNDYLSVFITSITTSIEQVMTLYDDNDLPKTYNFIETFDNLRNIFENFKLKKELFMQEIINNNNIPFDSLYEIISSLDTYNLDGTKLGSTKSTVYKHTSLDTQITLLNEAIGKVKNTNNNNEQIINNLESLVDSLKGVIEKKNEEPGIKLPKNKNNSSGKSNGNKKRTKEDVKNEIEKMLSKRFIFKDKDKLRKLFEEYVSFNKSGNGNNTGKKTKEMMSQSLEESPKQNKQLLSIQEMLTMANEYDKAYNEMSKSVDTYVEQINKTLNIELVEIGSSGLAEPLWDIITRLFLVEVKKMIIDNLYLKIAQNDEYLNYLTVEFLKLRNIYITPSLNEKYRESIDNKMNKFINISETIKKYIPSKSTLYGMFPLSKTTSQSQLSSEMNIV